jgi:CelD/BcsL family acetyltransferase involved in cellulose biosynthesis
MSSIRWFDASDPDIVSRWEALAESLQAGPFMRPGWFAAWAEAFGGDGSVLEVLGDSPLRALVPLIRTSNSPTCPVNEHSPEFALLADGEAGGIELVRHLLAEKPTSLELFKVPSETRDAVEAAAGRAGYRVVASIMQRSPYLELSGPWEDYEKSLSANFRQSLRRKKRRLEDEGSVSIETQDGRDDLDAALDEGFSVESSQWKAEEGTAIASDARVQSFYTAVARWAAERDWLRLVFLRLDGAPVAFRFDLVADGGYYHLKGGYDPAYARFSPGLILQHETVREAFDQGLARYEFLGADEPYKLKWTSTCRDRVAVRCFAPTVAGRLAWARRAWLGPLARRLKSASK